MNKLNVSIALLIGWIECASAGGMQVVESRRDNERPIEWKTKEGEVVADSVCNYYKENPAYKGDHEDCIDDAKILFADWCLIDGITKYCKAYKEVHNRSDYQSLKSKKLAEKLKANQ